MEPSSRAPGYDLFKAIVAILLLILFLILNRRVLPQSPGLIPAPGAQPATVPASSTSLSLTSTPLPHSSPTTIPAVASTQAPLLSPTTTSGSAVTDTPASSTSETSAASATQASLPSPTVTNVAEPTATPLPTSTATPAPVSTSTPIAGAPAASVCESASSRSRLQNGMNATILRRLNFRASPGIGDNWLLTNRPGTNVQVIGGPECIPHFSGAYVWWQIKLPDGQIGWSAEASQTGSFYFMEPTQ